MRAETDTENQLKKSTMDENKQKLFEHNLGNVYNNSYINLAIGSPGPKLLKYCTENFSLATENLLEKGANHLEAQYVFQYGSDVGHHSFRLEIATFLSEAYDAPVNYENLVQTAGATYGLHLILSTLVDMSGIIFVDDVIYMNALDIMADFNQMKIVPVPLTKNGPDMEKFRALVEEHKFKSTNKLFSAMYYTVPFYHNPTGIVFSENVRQELVALGQKHDLLIVCDDVYNLLTYDAEQPPKRIFAYDLESNPRGNVISNGSFTKIMSPGIRVGWMECPARIVDAFHQSGILKSGGAANNYSAGIVENLIRLGLTQKHLKKYQVELKKRMELSCKILRENLPNSCSFFEPKGGYFIWIQLPTHIDSSIFAVFCHEKFNVIVYPSESFSIERRIKNCLRISVGFQECGALDEALHKLCLAIDEYCSK